MNIFKIHRGLRRVGLGYGSPVFFVDCGVGMNWDATKVVNKLQEMGLNVGMWVVIRNNPIKEKGSGTLVQGLKFCRISVECEDDGTNNTPGWFPDVDRWIVEWKEGSKFNYAALRPRQDMIIYKGKELEKFLWATKDLGALKALVTDNIDSIFDKIKDYGVRVYEGERC